MARLHRLRSLPLSLLVGGLSLGVLVVFNLSRPPLQREQHAQFELWYGRALPELMHLPESTAGNRNLRVTVRVAEGSNGSPPVSAALAVQNVGTSGSGASNQADAPQGAADGHRADTGTREWSLPTRPLSDQEERGRLERILQLIRESDVFGLPPLRGAALTQPHLAISISDGESRFETVVAREAVERDIRLRNLLTLLELFGSAPQSPTLNPARL